ncbi:MAG: 50S ribosomal protein L15 [Candidatus Portnoybacteria bacterium CG10_big_fil_rev_8_21_14_0_10_36_7]|uniref:Large ribosomal subunit protein uL15 n=1 Tax=Candidatus Portnoybacteria bacterium CG10_big_fil_rev_8_21_14_0_10_36_7 TaxID=1974812 RepID=A0A2M8KDD3_9BACT|nr:MAG: 50S ribosomal protein L15 [Candidatus Portnoybacteria bacterium CG10_big_fil_rev_8_21_14_0_10_36_7]
MQIHDVKPNSSNRRSQRIGRGGKRGTYSGRGVKGYYAHSSSHVRPGFIGGDTPLFKKFPKKRGQGISSIHVKPAVLNLSVIEKYFKTNEQVNPKTLFEKGLIRKQAGALPAVKILGSGEIKKVFNFDDCKFSASAKGKVAKAGGKIKS